MNPHDGLNEALRDWQSLSHHVNDAGGHSYIIHDPENLQHTGSKTHYAMTRGFKR
jgi:hypothetical protein